MGVPVYTFLRVLRMLKRSALDRTVQRAVPWVPTISRIKQKHETRTEKKQPAALL